MVRLLTNLIIHNLLYLVGYRQQIIKSIQKRTTAVNTRENDIINCSKYFVGSY